MTYFELTDNEDFNTTLGLVFTNSDSESDIEEIKESWHDFHVLEEHELDPYDIDDFVEWHNENYVTQIERFYVTIL